MMYVMLGAIALNLGGMFVHLYCARRARRAWREALLQVQRAEVAIVRSDFLTAALEVRMQAWERANRRGEARVAPPPIVLPPRTH